MTNPFGTEPPYRAPAGGPIEAMACAVCGNVVDTLTEEIGDVEVVRTWQHTMATLVDDHPVVAVPVNWIQTKRLLLGRRRPLDAAGRAVRRGR